MAAEPTLVGLDVGTSGVKALALSHTGEIVARAEREYPLSTPRPGWAEQDPEDWWRASEAALADLAVDATTIGLSGQMHGLVALDERERVLRPAILWNDQRTGAECAEIEERVGHAPLRRRAPPLERRGAVRAGAAGRVAAAGVGVDGGGRGGRPGGRRARRRDRPAGAALGRARDVGRRL